jgi:PPOX class probable F420-dependent enzyme
MTKLHETARELLSSAALAHMVTLNADGSPQITCVWVGLDGEEIVAAHLNREQLKLRNLRRDPRVSLSIETDTTNSFGLREYLVVHGTARLTDGGAAELLQQLAHVYMGPDVEFPAMPDPPPGVITHIAVDRVSGIGPWVAAG